MQDRPNVILMFADDLGIGDLSCFNPDSKIHTANLDRMAAEGMRGTDVHATSALCTPSRYGLLTGRYNWRSVLKAMVVGGYSRHIIEEGRETLGTLFKRAGYQTACVGKWHLGLDWSVRGDDSILTPGRPLKGQIPDVDYSVPVRNGPNDCGFDYSYVTPGSLDIPPYVFLENGSVCAPPSAMSGVSRDAMAQRGVITDPNDARIYHWPEGECAAEYVHREVVPDSARRVLNLIDSYAETKQPFFIYYPIHAPHIPCLPTPEFEGRSGIGPYGDMVLMIDSIVGQIMDKLKEKGIDNDTLFLFTSDNGSENSYPELGHEPSYIYRGHKSDIWDGGHRIPFLVRWPSHIPAGHSTDQLCCLSDIYASFAEMLQIPLVPEEAEDSVSNLPLWLGGDVPVRDYIVHSSGGGCFSIREGRWKLELCPGSGGFGMRAENVDGLLPIQLYDMVEDVREQHNAAQEHPEIVNRLRDQLTAYILAGRSTPGAAQKNTGPQWWPQLTWIDPPAEN